MSLLIFEEPVNLTKERVIEILEEHLFVSDECGGGKLASWRWLDNVVVDGIDEAAEQIIKEIKCPC